MRPFFAVFLVVPTLLASCSTDLLGPGFERDFVHLGGCGDVYFYAVDAADRVLLTFSVDGVVAQARVAAETITTPFTLPHAEVLLRLEQGSRISDAICDDVIEQGGGPRVDRTWIAIAGTATVTIRPGNSPLDDQGDDLAPFHARGDLILDDVIFEDADGHRLTIDELKWDDVLVGWLPG